MSAPLSTEDQLRLESIFLKSSSDEYLIGGLSFLFVEEIMNGNFDQEINVLTCIERMSSTLCFH